MYVILCFVACSNSRDPIPSARTHEEKNTGAGSTRKQQNKIETQKEEKNIVAETNLKSSTDAFYTPGGPARRSPKWT